MTKTYKNSTGVEAAPSLQESSAQEETLEQSLYSLKEDGKRDAKTVLPPKSVENPKSRGRKTMVVMTSGREGRMEDL